jgi:hypothetical protein
VYSRLIWFSAESVWAGSADDGGRVFPEEVCTAKLAAG